jgi:hypothetical protein
MAEARNRWGVVELTRAFASVSSWAAFSEPRNAETQEYSVFQRGAFV